MPNIKSQKDRVVQAVAEQAHNKAIKTNPVSYTHLDVYKRQLQEGGRNVFHLFCAPC